MNETQRLCDKAIDDFLAALKFIEVKWLKNSYADHNIRYFQEDSGDVTFSCNEVGILSADLDNINLDETNSDEDYCPGRVNTTISNLCTPTQIMYMK